MYDDEVDEVTEANEKIVVYGARLTQLAPELLAAAKQAQIDLRPFDADTLNTMSMLVCTARAQAFQKMRGD